MPLDPWLARSSGMNATSARRAEGLRSADAGFLLQNPSVRSIGAMEECTLSA
jgi:hypothetical protein